jgi:hypothetical protein
MQAIAAATSFVIITIITLPANVRLVSAALLHEPTGQAQYIAMVRHARAAISLCPEERMRPSVIRALPAACLGLAVTVGAPARAQDLNDYPTSARAEYVFACMKANGETRHALDQCSCSIDVLASLLPYEKYVNAETVLSMSQVIGNLGTQFRSTEQAKTAVNDLRRAQAEAEVRCF